MNVSATSGPVSITANTNFGYSQSTEESNRVSSRYARDTVSKAVSSISERIREEKAKKISHEVEETNAHGFNNADGKGHISGVYRWVDKIYKMQVFDSSQRRMMYEFIIPEPAAQYIYLEKNKVKTSDAGMIEPEPPQIAEYDLVRDLTPDDLSDDNYIGWANKYGVTNIDLPPEQYITKSTSKGFPSSTARKKDDMIMVEGSKAMYILECNSIDTPQGYYPYSASFNSSYWKTGTTPDANCCWVVTVGNKDI